MDLFKYHACVKELELCKTVSGLEILIRKYQAMLNGTNITSAWNTPPEQYEKQILGYKLLTLSIKLYSAKSKKSLRDFIYNTVLSCHKILLIWILNYGNENYKGPFDKLIEYEQFMNWFEFDTVLQLPNKENFVENLNAIIGNNPIHFNVIFNNNLTNFDLYSTQLTHSSKQLIYAIRYKQVNFPTQPQTIWDLFLEKMRVQAHDVNEAEVARECLKLEQQIIAIKSFKDFYVKP